MGQWFDSFVWGLDQIEKKQTFEITPTFKDSSVPESCCIKPTLNCGQDITSLPQIYSQVKNSNNKPELFTTYLLSRFHEFSFRNNLFQLWLGTFLLMANKFRKILSISSHLYKLPFKIRQTMSWTAHINIVQL